MRPIAYARGGLSRWCRRYPPGYIHKIEKLRHIDLRFIPIRQIGELVSRFNELQDRGVVRRVVGYVMRLCKRGDDESEFDGRCNVYHHGGSGMIGLQANRLTSLGVRIFVTICALG